MKSILTLLMIAGVLALGACTSQSDLRKAELATLSATLPGEYRNPRQALTILRLAAPLVGDQVFYVRETMADDSRRVVSERIWSMDVAPGARLRAIAYALDEPDHWRGGVDNPDLFRPLLMRDLRTLPGCEMVWQKTAAGYSGESTTALCPQSWRLEGDELAFSDKAAAAAATAGASPTGGPDRYFHFRRSANPQP